MTNEAGLEFENVEPQRKAALDNMHRVDEDILSAGAWARVHKETIRAALSSPAVPVIDVLDRVNEVDMIDELSSEEQAAVLKVARAYVELQKGV